MYFKILSLALAVITFSGVAIADTVTVISPGPSSTTTTKSTYDWTGVYAGVNLGAVWSGSHLNANQANLVPSTGSYSQNMNSTAVNPGFQFGYLHQLKDNWVVGGEADFTYPSATSTFKTANAIGEFDQFKIHNNLQGSLRLRGGYAFDRFLPFITTGISFGSMKLQYNNEANDSYSTSTTQTGWVLGGGLEYGVLKNLSVRTEYLYTNYGNAMSMGLPAISGYTDPTGSAHANLSTNVLRAAVNYRF